MKILVLADEESEYLWDYFERSKFDGIDLIISCGDLDAGYLSFLATLLPIPVLYVHGNHDTKYESRPPEGCISIDGELYIYKGIRIVGLGGSMRYRQDVKNQYTEKEMKKRVRKLFFPILFHRGFDILVAHAPAKGINDGEDLAHQGFKVFGKMIKQYHPKYFVHGHVHQNYSSHFKRYDKLEDTTIVNAYERCIIEI